VYKELCIIKSTWRRSKTVPVVNSGLPLARIVHDVQEKQQERLYRQLRLFSAAKGKLLIGRRACIPRLIKSAKRRATQEGKKKGRPRSLCVILKINTARRTDRQTDTHAYTPSETNKNGKKKGNISEKKKKTLQHQLFSV
jgi:hypothetical protein